MTGLLPVAAEVVIAVVVPAAMAMAVVVNAQNTIDGAHSAADTGTDDTSDRTAHRTGNPVALVRPLLGATHDALGVAGLRQASQGKKDCGAREEQADG
jgi:hypothetical protein